MESPNLVVVGGINSDYLVRGPRLPSPGENLEGDRFLETPGGKGANQAVAAARLGARVALVARVGADDRGRALLSRLAGEGIAIGLVVHDGEAPTGATVIQIDGRGQKQTLAAPGANRRLAVEDVRRAGALIRSARAVLVQLEIPLECVAEALRLGRAAGALVVLDPAPPVPLPEELLRLVNVIKPNAREAEVLTGIAVRDRDSARIAAGRLLDRGVGAVAVQAGDAGNLIVWHDGELWLPTIPVASVDTTGAGDAFTAALAVALAEDRPWAEAGPFALAAAALATTALGAQAALPHRDAIHALLAQPPRRS
ncbi:MAG: ribokinase [Isosphaeraceae bacterium]|nr:ribokinase [Isosphaeraceae bacterium]